MPIKKDETGKRWVEMEFITPCTPEQVWRAIATGPGNTAGSQKPRSTSMSAAGFISTSVPMAPPPAK
ncbi:hypothetical protein [Mesorhizobium sp.]|uniref:hypothetical protein n=1 Tax=Mesorhizobium sp. TaxID=1871066 RepID=UPI00257B26E4|nr:hypothetical protein [Mesorhizobium sp.]